MDKAQARELNKKIWWGAIQNTEEAAYIIKSIAYGFYFLAVLQGVIGYWLVGPSAFFDAIIIALLAFLLHKSKKKVFAYLLLALMLFGLGVTLSNRLGLTDEGGRNFVLSIIFIWASIRALKAASFLAKNKIPPIKQVGAES